MTNLTGKTALVTGGSRGIGRAVAEHLKSLGAEVTIVGSNPESLAKAAAEMGVAHVAANLADSAAVKALAEQVGAVDILVNNAGITRDGLFLKMSEEQWQSVLQVNLNAAVQLTQALFTGMLKKKFGRVINITSVVGHRGNTGQANYVTAKAALTGFTKALAIEVARKNITVNCVAPGFIATKMTEELPEATQKSFLEQIPARRFGTVEEVASAVAFLAGDGASYITGQTLHVNGGLYV
jgi:3-oxoacyl-[acyl-carrier protein] reductase